MAEPVRLQKYISACGIMSRRHAEEAIAQSRVTVNGATATVGMSVDPDTDRIMLDGEPVVPGTGEPICVMLNKPRGYLSAAVDPRGRPCVTELTAGVGQRLYPVGRLDFDSEGLLLMTNDGELANLMMHPRNHIAKRYHVNVSGMPTDSTLSALNLPMEIDGHQCVPAEVKVLLSGARFTQLEFTLHEGRNRQIRKMCSAVGLHVLSLKRVAVGCLRLGDLPLGQWIRLTDSQLAALRRQATADPTANERKK